MKFRFDMMPSRKPYGPISSPPVAPVFSPALLKESKSIQKSIIGYFQNGGKKPYPVRYVVMASQTPGVFNLGGDLNLFIKLIAEEHAQMGVPEIRFNLF